ncbi:MAG: hypothetical protein WAV41_03545 [Microgenomates group bacterium]
MSQLTTSVFLEAKKYLNKNQDELLTDVEIVLNRLKNFDHISDYSFLVAPISKAYEGYLKDFFLELKIIDQYSYDSDRFRVGKTLNPSLRYKRFSVFQKLAELDDKGEEIAELLWDAWKHGRNEIFHYFPNDLHNLTRDDAENRIYLVLSAIIKSGEFRRQNSKGIDLL